MAENCDELSTLVGTDTQSSVNINDEDDQCFEKSEEITAGVKINPNRFRLLCANVENCLSEIDKSMFEVLELKDKLLLQYLPRTVSLQITLVFSRFYRAYSQSQIPFDELIRLVRLYSGPWDMKCTVLKRLYDSNEIKKRMLHLAIQRLVSVEHVMQQQQEQRSINNWEKMYIRRALPRSNVRKWKFRMKTFREKAELGYEHVMKWLDTKMLRPLLVSDTLLNEEPIDEQDFDRFEISNEMVNIEKTTELKSQINHDSKDDNEIGSDNLLHENENSKPVEQHDIEIQAQPDLDDQQTSTDDILSTKSLLMRIYRPIGMTKTKFQCVIHTQGQKYTTKMFIFNKSNVQLTSGNRIPKTKQRNEVSTASDLNTIDKQQTDQFLIPMPNVLQRHSLFQTDIDPNTIKIEIFGDGKLCGSFILSSEDLRMLDLPNLHSPTFSPFIALEDNLSTNNLLDFDQSSNTLYQSWIARTPPIFSIYNKKSESIGKLPLLMFWYNKIENSHATKSTMTMPMEVYLLTPKTEVVVPSVTAEITDENIEINSADDQIEIIKENYENEIAKLHENYQAEITRLTNLLNQIVSDQLDETSPKIIQEDLSNTKTGRRTKRDIVTEHPSSLIYGKDLPKNFLDRYQMYLQRSILHRHQLSTKIERETALANERQMEIQHRLYRSEQKDAYDEDLCLPAVFMPFRSGNVINPRAYQFFHPVGSVGRRLTQAPSIIKFPSLPARSVSVLNLFELSRSSEGSNGKDQPKNQTSDSNENSFS